MRKPTNCRDWAGAERAKHDLLKQWEAAAFGPIQNKSTASVAKAAELHLADKQEQGLASVSVAKIKRTLDALVEFLEKRGGVSLNAITPEHLIQYRATWTHLTTLYSRKNEQTRLNSFFLWCHINELSVRNPALKLATIKKGKHEPTMPFEPEEMTAILQAIPRALSPYQAQRVRALIRLMRWSGLGIRDAVMLLRNELQFYGKDYNVVRRRIKTKVPINNRIPNDVALELLGGSWPRPMTPMSAKYETCPVSSFGRQSWWSCTGYAARTAE